MNYTKKLIFDTHYSDGQYKKTVSNKLLLHKINILNLLI